MRIISSLLIILLSVSISCNHGNEKYTELAPEIYLLGKDQPVKSLQELTAIFKGEALFIDRWATWCSPCVEEFQYKDSLYKYLNSRDIKMLYLNSDKDIQADTLITFVKIHELRGYHLHMNDDLKTDLVKFGVFIPMIPQYILINSDGKVVKNRTMRPSDGERLFVQIDSLLGKPNRIKIEK